MERKVKLVSPGIPALQRKKRVAAYARVSCEKDAALKSLSAQISYYSDYIQRHVEWDYAGVYADEALTGTKDTRAEFQRMLADCRIGLIDLVLTKSISRFARNTVTLLETVRELKRLKVDVYFERENIHSMSGDGELMLTILASFAQEESLSASLNGKWQYKKRFEEGKLAGLSVLYGYRIINGQPVVDSAEAEIVRSIFTDYVKGVGVSVIMRRLQAADAPTIRGGKWSHKRINDILANEKYTGNALLQKTFITDHLTKQQKPNRGELPMYYAEGTHEAIIDRETYDRARSICERNAILNNVKHDTPAKYPFSGKIRCQNCGAKYKRVKYKGREKWNCTNFLRYGKSVCHSKQIPETTLMAVTAEILGLTIFDERIFNREIAEIIIPQFNKIVYIFRDGRQIARVWEDRSRSDSWTEEKREQARQKALIQRGRSKD